MSNVLTEAQIWEILDTVPDPEIPVVSMVDLGIIQTVQLAETGDVHIQMTPTFSGCPALEMMQDNVREALVNAGLEHVEIEIVLDPPWTSDRISAKGRQKMAEFGIAPPQKIQGRDSGAVIMFLDEVACPFCQSKNTKMENPFGPTLCRAIYYCHDCQQAFELFKPL